MSETGEIDIGTAAYAGDNKETATITAKKNAGLALSNGVETVVEKKEPREVVLEAFTEAFAIFESYPKDKLNPKQLFAIEMIRSTSEKTIKKGQDYYMNVLSNKGINYQKRGSVPIEELKIFLDDRVKSGELSPEDSEKYRQLEQILFNNSKNVDGSKNEKKNLVWQARINQEVERIRKYPDLVNLIQQEGKRATLEENLQSEANRMLLERRELIIPPKEKPVPVVIPKIEVRTGALVSREVDEYKKARELSSKLIQKEMESGNALNPLGWGKKVGLYLLRPYWEQRLTQEIVTQTEKAKNAYSTLDLDQSKLVLRDLFRGKTGSLVVKTDTNREAEQESAKAKVQNIKERFAEGLTEGGGEVSKGVEADIIEAKGEVKESLDNKIIKRIVVGEITNEAELQTALAQLVLELQANPNPDQDIKNFMKLFGSDANQFNRLTQYFASDLLQQGLDVKADIDKEKEEMDKKLQTIEQRTKYLLANPKWGAESEAYFGVTDRWVAKIASHRSGALLNAGTVGAGFAVGAALLTRGSTALQLAGLTVPGIGAIFGGGAAYLRKRQEYSANRQVYNLENAYNETPADKKMEQRAKIFKKSNYETESAKTLLDTLHQKIEVSDMDGIVDAIADISSRISFNDEQLATKKPMIDLITFENRYQVEQARAKLDSEMILARRTLREAIKAKDQTTDNEETKIQNAKAEAQTLINDAVKDKLEAIRNDYNKKNSKFNVDARDASLRYAVKVAAFGFAGGLISQEGLAIAARAVPGLTEIPLAGGFFRPGQTTIEKGVHAVGSLIERSELGTGPANINSFAEIFNSGGRVDINNHITAQGNPDHSIILVDKTTNLPLPNQPKFFNEPNGYLITTGNPDNLPNEMRSWPKSETTSHSVYEQINEAVKSGNQTELISGNTHIKIDGSNVDIDNARGTISQDNVLHLNNNDSNLINKVHDELLSNGFKGDVIDKSTIQLIDHPSTLDQIKEIVKNSEISKTSFNGFNTLIEGHGGTGDISIIPNNPNLPEIKGVVDQNGGLHFQATADNHIKLSNYQGILENAGFKGVQIEEIPGKTITEDATEHFRNLDKLEPSNRGEFLNNGTPNIYDKNELKLDLNLTSNGSINADMSRMIQENTIPASVNQDIITKPDGSQTFKNFFVQFTLDDAGDNAREVIRVPFDSTGHFTIPSDSDLNQLFKPNVDGNVTQLTRFTEVTHFNEETGKFDILATSSGAETGSITTTTPSIHSLEATPPNIPSVDEIKKPLFTYDATPPKATEIIPPAFESPPIIPFIFESGRPLIMKDRGSAIQENPSVPKEKEQYKEDLRQKRLELNQIDNNPNLSPEEKLTRKNDLTKEMGQLKSKLQDQEALTESESALPLENIFGRIKGEVSSNHEYFVSNPSAEIVLSNSDLDSPSLKSFEPLFQNVNVENNTFRFETNPKAVPFVWNQIGDQERFINGEGLTKGDSGLLALCAVSAETPEKQAISYKALSQAILQIHHNNPDLLETWIKSQGDGGSTSSLFVFAQNDWDPQVKALKPKDQILVQFTEQEFNTIWTSRIQELQTAISNNQLKPHHLRWIEFLSHSINIPELIKIAQKQQTSPAPAPAPASVVLPSAAPIELSLTESNPQILVQQLNETLNSSGAERRQIVLGIDDLVNYVQQVNLPNNAKIQNPTYRILPNGHILISANISASKLLARVNTSFSAELANRPGGGMEVVQKQVGDLGWAEMFRGSIEGKIANLTQEVQSALSKQTPGWKVTNFRLTPEQKLSFDFQKDHTQAQVI